MLVVNINFVRFLKVDAFVENVLGKDTTGHDAHHCRRVAKTAVEIASSITDRPVDLSKVWLAAMLHDVWDSKVCDQPERMEMAVSAMLGEVISDGFAIDDVLAIIHNVSWSKGGPANTIEAACVQDADRLDAIGAIGIARVFAYGESQGRNLQESVQHFHEKLLKIKNAMNTSQGQLMAHARHQVMLRYLEDLEVEGL